MRSRVVDQAHRRGDGASPPGDHARGDTEVGRGDGRAVDAERHDTASSGGFAAAPSAGQPVRRVDSSARPHCERWRDQRQAGPALWRWLHRRLGAGRRSGFPRSHRTDRGSSMGALAICGAARMPRSRPDMTVVRRPERALRLWQGDVHRPTTSRSCAFHGPPGIRRRAFLRPAPTWLQRVFACDPQRLATPRAARA